MSIVQKNQEKKMGNKTLEETVGTNTQRNVSTMVDIDAFLLAYAREKYGLKPEKEKQKKDSTETLKVSI